MIVETVAAKNEAEPSTSYENDLQFVESFQSTLTEAGDFNPPMTFAYNEYGQEIACGLDVTEYFQLDNEVQVIGEVTVKNFSSDDDEQEKKKNVDKNMNEDRAEGGEVQDTAKSNVSRRSGVIKKYTYAKTQMNKKFMTLMEKKNYMRQLKEDKKKPTVNRQTYAGKGKASKKFPAKNRNKDPGANLKKPQLVRKESQKQKRLVVRKKNIKESSPKKYNRPMKNKNNSLTFKGNDPGTSGGEVRYTRVKHVYASIPQPKIRKEKVTDKDYRPTYQIDHSEITSSSEYMYLNLAVK